MCHLPEIMAESRTVSVTNLDLVTTFTDSHCTDGSGGGGRGGAGGGGLACKKKEGPDASHSELRTFSHDSGGQNHGNLSLLPMMVGVRRFTREKEVKSPHSPKHLSS